jgi:hypothetical protein
MMVPSSLGGVTFDSEPMQVPLVWPQGHLELQHVGIWHDFCDGFKAI